MAQRGSGKSYREGISILELADIFPDEASAAAWFEAVIWPNGRHCLRCGSIETIPASATSGLPYYCQGCHKTFSVRTGTALERSRVPFRKWVFAIYLEMTSLKGVSSMKLHRDIKVTQKTAWFMLHRIREAWKIESASLSGPLEVDEAYFGGKRRNMPKSKRKHLTGRGAVDKTAVVGVKDRGSKHVRAKAIDDTTAQTLQGFVRENTETRRWSTRMRPAGIVVWAQTSVMKRSIMASESMSGAWRIPMASSPSGRCSSGPTRASITRSVPSTLIATSTSLQGVTTSGNWTPLNRWAPPLRG